MNLKTILVIEDELFTKQLISRCLTREGYLILMSGDSTDALKLLDLYPIDLVLLNTFLNGVDSSILYKAIKSQYDIPFIFLKPDNALKMKLPKFDSASDDFMTKPFYPDELITRVRIALDETDYSLEEDYTLLSAGPYELNCDAKEVYCNGQVIDLSRREYDLAEHLIMNKNIVFSRDQLLEEVWGFDYDGNNRTVDTHIKKLRHKLDPSSEYIKTVWGTGYKFKTR